MNTRALTIAIFLLLLIAVHNQENEQNIESPPNSEEVINTEAFEKSKRYESVYVQESQQNGFEPELASFDSSEYEHSEEERDMLQFSEHMGDFIPTETFTFVTTAGFESRFLLWPDQEVESIRGMFHAETKAESEVEMEFSIKQGEASVKEFLDQRLGVFNIPNQSNQPITFSLKTKDSIEFYFSYEYRKKHLPEKKHNATIKDVTDKFNKIDVLTVYQEREMKHILKLSQRHAFKIQQNIDRSALRLIAETLIIVATGFFSLWILKQQLEEGYQLLI